MANGFRYPTSTIQRYKSLAGGRSKSQAKDGIKFNKLVSGKEQVGEGMNLDLIIHAWNRDGKDAKYEAELHLRDWMDKRTLLSFKPAN